jgi:hypothetical protein
MQEMGFVYVDSTAGSSVRFDPPDPTASVSVLEPSRSLALTTNLNM